MIDSMPTKQEKCQGAMIATAIGDALGWPNETRSKNVQKNSTVNDMFVSWIRNNRYPCWHQEQILPGEYSDDTQMLLAVARSILTENWENSLVRYELPYWLSYQRGGGTSLLKAATACKEKTVLWKKNNLHDYFAAGGNGVAMRILPHVIGRIHSESITELMAEVLRDGIITHGHPRALLGATCYAYTLNYLLKKNEVLKYGEIVSAVLDGQKTWGHIPDFDVLNEWKSVAVKKSGYDYTAVWNETVSYMVKQLIYIQDALNKGLMEDDRKVFSNLECYSKINGAGDVAVLTAIYLTSKYANNPALGIKVPAFAVGMDTDTIASMTGAMLGMICGTSWIPNEWRLVQDYNCFLQMTELLMSDKKLENSKTYISQVTKEKDGWNKTPMGMLRQIDSYNISATKMLITVKKLQTAFGQTIYVKDYQMKEKGSTQLPSGNQPTPESMQQRQMFCLDLEAVNNLINDPKISKKTCKKLFQIIKELLINQNSLEEIARKFQVDLQLVNIIGRYIYR